MNKLPKVGRHSSGQARTTLNGVVYYLGVYDSLAAQKAYVELIERWEANGRRPLEPARTAVEARTLKDLFTAWQAQLDAAGRYRKAGRETSARQRIRHDADEFLRRFGDLPTNRYAAEHLLLHRDELETREALTRNGINRKVATIREGLRWGYERGRIGRDAWLATRELRPLSRAVAGHRDFKHAKRAPSAQEIEAVAVAAGPVVGRMMRVHYLLGCRPGELVSLRWCDIDRTPVEGCWTYRVPDEIAKTAHHGKVTMYAIPPRAQALLAEIPCASPSARVFAGPPTKETTQRKNPTTAATVWYRERLQRACRLAGVPPFGGHEVRHGAVTAACAKFGAFAAASFANHSKIATTETYVHQDNRNRYLVAAGLAGDVAAS
ncbi:MAG: site-specific integrase [Planctomycetota bacterium]